MKQYDYVSVLHITTVDLSKTFIVRCIFRYNKTLTMDIRGSEFIVLSYKTIDLGFASGK